MDGMWIWLRRRTLDAAVRALKILSADRHREASVESDPARRAQLRAEADYDDAEAEELRRAIHEPKEKRDGPR